MDTFNSIIGDTYKDTPPELEERKRGEWEAFLYCYMLPDECLECFVQQVPPIPVEQSGSELYDQGYFKMINTLLDTYRSLCSPGK